MPTVPAGGQAEAGATGALATGSNGIGISMIATA
jgi:hypothetical protein